VADAYGRGDLTAYKAAVLLRAGALTTRLARMADPGSEAYGATLAALEECLDALGLEIEPPKRPGSTAKRLPERALKGLSPLARRMYEEGLEEDDA
jgi:hypothetical protein